MADKQKTIVITRRLAKAFPEAIIKISESFSKYPHNESIEVNYTVVVTRVGVKSDLTGLLAVEEYADNLIKEKA